MYLALGITAVVYVAIALGVFGTLTVAQVVKYGATAIAEAARPPRRRRLHGDGARRDALDRRRRPNATLYASANLTGMLAKAGLFPAFFGAGSRLGRRPAW